MRIIASLVVLPLLATGALFVACSEDTPEAITTPNTDAGSEAGDGGTATLDVPSMPCTDSEESIYADPGALSADPSARGAVLKCNKQPDLAKDAMQAKATELGYSGKPLTSGAHVYKILFRTERGDAASSPGYSSALVFIPDTPRADKLPIIVGARGSRGQAEKCAVTKLDPALQGINDDALRMIYPLVGSGYAFIVPDLAGYANFGAAGNPPSAYAQAADVGRGTLDGSRALKKLFPALDDKVVLVGHSQGGHSALAALAMSETYGAAAPIVGTAVYAPLWVTSRAWGALLYRPVGQDYPIAQATSIANVDVWYHYTQGELLDGPGEGKKVFKADKQAAIEEFVKNECWGTNALSALGVTYIDELYDPTFVSDVSFVSATGGSCDGNAQCEKWVARYVADRPHLTGKAATTPILLAYGLKDDTLTQPRMKCGIERLGVDKVNLKVCVDSEMNHNTIVSGKGEYVADWIASLTLGGAEPAPCALNESAVTAACVTPPPND